MTTFFSQSLEYVPSPSTLLSHYHHRGLSLSYSRSPVPPHPRHAYQSGFVNVEPQFTVSLPFHITIRSRSSGYHLQQSPQDSNTITNTTHYSSATLNAGFRENGVAQRSSDF